ncbi:MAG: outer membrane beta-barrel protein [Desulfohalobiaceae bacterium]|nr:outer membrane beta-barrel protein [Desulfohalobiaceae bacterium]
MGFGGYPSSLVIQIILNSIIDLGTISTLRYLKQAEAEGVRTPNLRYNLGVTHYRMGHYEEAEEAFRLLAEYPDWRHLALYNLGLIAEARGDRQAAVDYYSQVREAAGGSGAGQRAAQKLEELTGEEPSPAPGRVYSELSAAAGYDDNAILASEDGAQDVSEQGDLFTELYGLTSVYTSGDGNDGVRLDANAFTRLYASKTDYSFSSLSGDISRHKEYGPWRTSLGVGAAVELAGSDLFAVVPAAKLKGERSFGAYTLELSNTLNWIEGSGDYDHLTGVQNQLTVRLERDIPGGETYAGIGAEYNDRKDLSDQGEFFSHSPLRGDIHAGLDYALTQRWTLALSGQYRKSLYPDENRMEIDGSITEDEREDDRILVSVRGEYDVSRSVIGFAEYTRTDNDSNFSRNSYESNRFLVGMRWTI